VRLNPELINNMFTVTSVSASGSTFFEGIHLMFTIKPPKATSR